MAKAKNTFLRSKMNKDIDARIIPSGEYRDARNVQVSRSEGDGVGSLENVLGNTQMADFKILTGVSNLTCIGSFADDINNNIYLFFTDYLDLSAENFVYNKDANNFIYSYNTVTKTATKLAQGSFLNFSKTNFIYGINVLENILFWTDNRNQPRKLNINLALENNNYYNNEDQISVASYNPYKCIQLFRESQIASTGTDLKYETTMLDVVSKFYPNGGTAQVNTTTATTYAAGTDIPVVDFEGKIYVGSEVKGVGASSVPTGTKVTSVDSTGTPIQLDQNITIQGPGGVSPSVNDKELIFEPNPYYDAFYNGDPNYLENKFVRFSYRFTFNDNENSIFATFTQPTFIPKQDGYFKQVTPTGQTVVNDDQKQAYTSTVVEFMENKVNNIFLYIPLPFKNYDLAEKLNVSSIDILYKESNQTSVKVIEEVKINDIINSSAIAQINGSGTGTDTFNVDNIKGGIQVGALVTGGVIPFNITVKSYVPTSTSNPNLGGVLVLSDTITGTLPDDSTITIGDPDFYIYEYQSRKPTKVLPEADLIRVYDKTPVRALAQEVISNRIVYGNFQNKHTPPANLDYNVNTSPKADFNTLEGSATISSGATGSTTITVTGTKGGIWNSGNVIGCIVTTNAIGANIPDGTLVVDFNSGTGVITLTNNITISVSDIILLVPGSDTQKSTSLIEYPNHSVKQNRNYQIGFVLSDRYGRQSSTILSDSLSSVTVGLNEFVGSTIFSPYNSLGEITNSTWPGDSLKISFNNVIGPSQKNTRTGWPGLYNGDSTSADYNPLGWYSWKIVVKQTEQEYYNVYLPGIMAAYPKDVTKEIGKTSHAVLINDNINKIPRDLSEVGPQQKQFRSSVQLFGRVQNLDFSTGLENNEQYYPNIKSDTVSVISTIDELFDFSPLTATRPDYFPQFYNFNSNPLIARITTQKQIGVTADTGFSTATAFVDSDNTPPSSLNNQITLQQNTVEGSIAVGMIVRGGNLPDGTTVTGLSLPVISVSVDVGSNPGSGGGTPVTFIPDGALLSFFQPETPGLQHLAVYETEPVESLLDIFWETSSSGLISDLNDAVLYDNNGAAGLNGFDFVNFKESIIIGDFINASPFFVGNIFGANLTNAGTDFTLEITECIDLGGVDRSSDFQLVIADAAAGSFNLKTASMFVFNSNPSDRVFYFQFKATVIDPTGVEPDAISFFNETVSLENEIPVILGSRENGTLRSICSPEGVFLTLSNGDPNPALVTIDQLDTIAVATLEAENGSRFYEDGSSTNQTHRSSEGLQWEIYSQYPGPTQAGFQGGGLNWPYLYESQGENNVEENHQMSVYVLDTENVNLNSDASNNGVSFLRIIKTEQTWRGSMVLRLRLKDADGSDSSYTAPTCKIIINAETAYVDKAWAARMRTPKGIPAYSDPNFAKDSEATLDAVISANTFSVKDIVYINPFGNDLDLFPVVNWLSYSPPTPIRTGVAVGDENAGAGSYTTANQFGGVGDPNFVFLPPNSRIYDKSNGNLLGQVSSIVWTAVPEIQYSEFGFPLPDPTPFGTKADITTVSNIDLTGVTEVVFACGQWKVSNRNSHDAVCEFIMRPNTYTNFTFPYLVPGTTQQASPSDWTFSNSLSFCTKTGFNNTSQCFCTPLVLLDYTQSSIFTQGPGGEFAGYNGISAFYQDDNGILSTCPVAISGDFPNCSVEGNTGTYGEEATESCNGQDFGCDPDDLNCP